MENAGGKLLTLLWVGVGAIVLGALIAISNWPGQEVCSMWYDDNCDTGLRQSGDASAVLSGLAVAGLGQMLLFVSLVGWAVKWGVQAASHDATVKSITG